MTLKVRILPFLTTFVELSTRLKNFLGGWLLVLGIKEGLVECATVCVKSVVILTKKDKPMLRTSTPRAGNQKTLTYTMLKQSFIWSLNLAMVLSIMAVSLGETLSAIS